MTNIIIDRDKYTEEIFFKANNWSERDLAFFNQIKFPEETPESLYESTAYYLEKFYLYEQGKKYLGWNWTAFIFGFFWGNYRKIYRIFFIEIFILLFQFLLVISITDDSIKNINALNSSIFIMRLGYRINLGCYANSIYIKKIIKKIEKGSSSYTPSKWLMLSPIIFLFIISVGLIIVGSHSS